jgi:hypothetical protein
MAKYKITIPEPCHEKWAEMSATERGAFCHSCKKEVIDFTGLTTTELGDYLKRNTLSCGRFTPTQLEANYIIAKDKPGRKWFYKGWLAAIISLFLSLINSKAEAKNIAPRIEWVAKSNSDKLLPNVNEEPIDSGAVFVSGKVTDEQGQGLPSVVFYLNDQPAGMSDIDGNFKLKVPQEFKGRTVTITARMLGFEVTNQKLGIIKNDSIVNMKMVLHYAVMGVMIMEIEEEEPLPVTPVESKVWWGVKYGIWD